MTVLSLAPAAAHKSSSPGVTERNVAFVPRNSLCTGCGTCSAACPQDAISMWYNARSGLHEPVIDSSRCTGCGLCVEVCPGFRLDLNDRPQAQAELPRHELIGPYAGIWRAYSLDKEVRRNGASGGVITETIAYLLEKKLVDKAIVTKPDPDNPFEALPYLAASKEELAAGQRSFYAPNALNEILKPIIRERSGTRYVFMGLPSHVHGLRLLQKAHPELREKIPYVISSFTAHVPSRRATEYTLFANGIRPEDVTELRYRSGLTYGHMVIRLRSGETREIPHLDWSYSGFVFPNFFYPVREWLYFDKLSQWADFSMGDNWQWAEGEADRLGVSTIVTRSEAAEQIVTAMMREGRIQASAMSTEMLVRDQELHKKLNIGVRLAVWKALGRAVPEYTPGLPVRWRDFLRTLRFALYILISERHLSLTTMDRLIRFEFFRRKDALPRVRRALSARWSLFRTRLSTAKQLLLLLLRGFRIEAFQPPRREANPRVIVVGGYGHEDIGDESMPHSVRLNLRRAVGEDLEIIMLSECPAKTAARHDVESQEDLVELGHSMKAGKEEWLRCWIYRTLFLWGARAHTVGIRLAMWPHGRAILDTMVNSDLLFNVGGGNLNSIITGELYKKGVQYCAMHILGKRVIVSGQTVGPLVGRRDRAFARKALSSVDLLTFRDHVTSLERCRDLGLSGIRMHDAADDAMTLPTLEVIEARTLLEKELGAGWLAGDRPIVLMNLKGSMSIFSDPGVGSRDLAPEIRIMAVLADLMIERLNVRVVFVPTDYSDGVDDRVLHRAIMDLMTHQEFARGIESEYSDVELKGFTQLAAMTVGARYHFHVFAAASCVPFFGVASGIYQTTKLKGLAELCGLPECYWPRDMGDSDPEEIYAAIERVFARRKEISAQLRSVTPELGRRSLSTIDCAAEFLRSRRAS